MLRAFLSIPVILTLILVGPGCTREPSVEQRRADLLLTQAREACAGGRLREGRTLLAEAHALDSRLGRAPQMAAELELLADLAVWSGAHDSAFALYEAAGAQYRSLGDRDGGIRMTVGMAALHRSGGASDRAFEMLTEALRLARLFKDTAGARVLLGALVPAARSLERRDEEVFHQEFLEEARRRNDAAALARGHLEAGRSAAVRRDGHREIDELLRALNFSTQAGDSLLGIAILAQLADAYARQGSIRESFETYTIALTRCDATPGAGRIRIAMLTRVGNTYLRTGAPAEAVRFYRAALDGAMALGDRLMEGYLFVQLGHCDAGAGALDDAARKYMSAADLFEAVRHRQGAAYALTSLGNLAERRRQFVEALQFYQRAFSEEEEVFAVREAGDLTLECEQALPAAMASSGGDGAVALLLQTGRSDEALRLLDVRIARRGAAALQSLTLGTGDATVDSLLAVQRSARERRIALERAHTASVSGEHRGQELLPELISHLAHADRRIADVEQMLRETAPVCEPALRHAGLPAAEIQRLVPPGSALLIPVPTSRSLYLLGVTAAGMTVDLSATGRDELTRQAQELRSLLARRVALEDSLEFLRNAADRRIAELSGTLYSSLVRPIERLLAMPGPLYVVLPPELDGLPFHALGRAAGTSVRRPVEEQVAVHYLPSIGSLRMDRRPPRSRYALVAMGHPGESGWDVEYELRDIRAFDKDVHLLFGRRATLDSLRAAKGDVVHAALELRYGVLDPGNARVLVSDGRTADGVRAARWGELLTLPTASLMIMSDLGPHTSGKNAALAQLLLMTRTPVVGLHAFSPHRRSRKVFGEHLYTALLAGAAPDAAFHQALLQMQRTAGSSGIHHWGAFQLWGK